MKSHNVLSIPEKKPKKKKKVPYKWYNWVLVAFVAVAIIIPCGFLIKISHEKAEIQLKYNLLNSNVMNKTQTYKKALKSAGWRIAQLKKLNWETNSFAMACLEKRNVYKYIAEDFKAWGADMEKLAQIHAKTFKELRIANDTLTAETKTLKYENAKLRNAIDNLVKELLVKTDIVANQKKEIERLSDVSSRWWSFIREMKLQKKVEKWLDRRKN